MTNSGHPEGESIRVGFDEGIKLEFHAHIVCCNKKCDIKRGTGLIAYRDLDYALGLFDSVSADFTDKRTDRNIEHNILTLLRQSI